MLLSQGQGAAALGLEAKSVPRGSFTTAEGSCFEKDVQDKKMWLFQETLEPSRICFPSKFSLWVYFFPSSLLICFVFQGRIESLSSEIHCELLLCSNKIQVLCPRKRGAVLSWPNLHLVLTMLLRYNHNAEKASTLCCLALALRLYAMVTIENILLLLWVVKKNLSCFIT